MAATPNATHRRIQPVLMLAARIQAQTRAYRETRAYLLHTMETIRMPLNRSLCSGAESKEGRELRS